MRKWAWLGQWVAALLVSAGIGVEFAMGADLGYIFITFGALVGLIATYRGYISEPTAAGVSAATTGTVVIGSVSILVFDFFLNGFWGV